jgi:hypothetical protein
MGLLRANTVNTVYRLQYGTSTLFYQRAGFKVSRGSAPAPLNLASYGPGSCFVAPI